MEIKDLEQILGILKQNDVSEFELENNGVHLKLTRITSKDLQLHSHAYSNGEVQPAIVTQAGVTQGQSHGVGSATHASTAGNEALERLSKVESPLVGTFYRKPSPDAEPFVSEGTVVKKGQTLCIVEAMKLMNEIESPCDGKITRVVVTDGQVVEFGEVLFLIDPNA